QQTRHRDEVASRDENVVAHSESLPHGRRRRAAVLVAFYQARASKWIGPSKGLSVAMSTTTCPSVGGFCSVHPALSGPPPPAQNPLPPSARRSTTWRIEPNT